MKRTRNNDGSNVDESVDNLTMQFSKIRCPTCENEVIECVDWLMTKYPYIYNRCLNNSGLFDPRVFQSIVSKMIKFLKQIHGNDILSITNAQPRRTTGMARKEVPIQTLTTFEMCNIIRTITDRFPGFLPTLFQQNVTSLCEEWLQTSHPRIYREWGRIDR